MVEGIESAFPRLRNSDWRVTSQYDDRCNCIAWAANSSGNWWWPVGLGKTFWPEGVPRQVSLEAFRQALATLGYVDCENENLEPGTEKIAVFASAEGVPTHAARQLVNGRWTSKLGKMEDIDHKLRDLEGTIYGSVALFMKRPLHDR